MKSLFIVLYLNDLYYFVQVYEVIVEDKGKDFIFLRLSRKCVSDLELSNDDTIDVEVGYNIKNFYWFMIIGIELHIQQNILLV